MKKKTTSSFEIKLDVRNVPTKCKTANAVSMNSHQQVLQQQLLLQQQQQQQQQQAVQLQQQIVDSVLKHLQRGQDGNRSLSQRRESFQEIQSIILHVDNRFFIQATYTQLAGHIQPLLQDTSEDIANTAAMLLGALGSVLDVTVQGWYNYILEEMMKRQSHAEHRKDFRHLVLSLAEVLLNFTPFPTHTLSLHDDPCTVPGFPSSFRVLLCFC